MRRQKVVDEALPWMTVEEFYGTFFAACWGSEETPDGRRRMFGVEFGDPHRGGLKVCCLAGDRRFNEAATDALASRMAKARTAPARFPTPDDPGIEWIEDPVEAVCRWLKGPKTANLIDA